MPLPLLAPYLGPALKPLADRLKKAGTALGEDLTGAVQDTLADPFAYRGEQVERAARVALACAERAHTEILLELLPTGVAPSPPSRKEKTFAFHAARRLSRHGILRWLFPRLREYHELESFRGALGAFRERNLPWLRAAVDVLPNHDADRSRFLRQCWQEWRQARREGVPGGEGPDGFTPGEPLAGLERGWRAAEVPDRLRRRGLVNLAWLFSLRPPSGAPLPVAAVRFFFFRAVEEDERLFRSFVWGMLDRSSGETVAGLAALHEAIARVESRLDNLGQVAPDGSGRN